MITTTAGIASGCHPPAGWTDILNRQDNTVVFVNDAIIGKSSCQGSRAQACWHSTTLLQMKYAASEEYSTLIPILQGTLVLRDAAYQYGNANY